VGVCACAMTESFRLNGIHLPGKRVRQRLEMDLRQKCKVTARRKSAERLIGDISDDRFDSIEAAINAFNRHTQPPSQHVVVDSVQSRIYAHQSRR